MSNLSTFVKRIRDIMRNDAGINGDAQRIEQIAWMLFLKVYDSKEQDWEFDDEDYISIIPEEVLMLYGRIKTDFTYAGSSCSNGNAEVEAACW